MRGNALGDHGTVMILVIIASFIMSIIGLATIYLGGLQEIAARAELDVVRANLAADAGIERGRLFLGTSTVQSATVGFPENVRGDRFPFQLADEDVGAWGRYVVEIRPSQDNNIDFVTPGNSLVGTYLISSTGTISNGVSGTMDTQKVKFAMVRIFHGQIGPPAVVNLADPVVSKKLDNAYIEEAVIRKVH